MGSYEVATFFTGLLLGILMAVLGFCILFWVRVVRFFKTTVGHHRRRLFSHIDHGQIKHDVSKAEILEILEERGKITYSAIEHTLGISHNVAHTCLMELEDEGMVNVRVTSTGPVYVIK